MFTTDDSPKILQTRKKYIDVYKYIIIVKN